MDVLTSGGKYPEREQSDECTSQVRAQAADLAERVSKLLDHIGIYPSISSGFRTKDANAAVGGAKNSAHLSGRAVDLADANGTLETLITDDLLERFNLWREDPARTKGWVHLDTVPRKNRTFKV